jgi:SAM-dependent methyltransferase
VATRHDYSRQARTYDTTRAASPSVLGPLRATVESAPGRTLVDVGGGTGNYSAALREVGLHPVVADFNPGMLAVAATKQLTVVRADAADLPFADRSVDVVLLCSMLHHVPDWSRALAEARRITRPGGRVVLMVFAREHLEVHWIMDYFPETTAHFVDAHQTMAELEDALPGATATPIRYDDLVDGSMAALCRRPELLLDPDVRRQTSYFDHAETEHPDELAAGVRALERDLAAGRRPDEEVAGVRDRIGDAVLLTWTSPAS